MIDLAFVESLIKALDASGLDWLELERGGTRIRLSKSPAPNTTVVAGEVSPTPVAAVDGAPAVVPPSPREVSPLPAAESTGVAAEEPAPAAKGLVEVTSPMVGTFYRAPSPDSPPYVEVGSRVGQGTVLCIIEAMKLMNELECEIEGTIAKILVDNAQPVEYGQVLFLIDPS